MKSELPRVDVWIDGERSADRRISVLDRGLLYGDSVFETLRTYGGRPFALPEHLDRLAESAHRVGIPWPSELRALDAEVRRAIDESGFREAYVRVMLTRGEGPLGLIAPEELRPTRIVLVASLVSPPDALYEQGASAITFKLEPRFGLKDLAGAKMGNYVPGILAQRAARAAQADEAIFADRRGLLSEGATSNLFLIRGARLVTPGDDAGILPGITRAAVLRLAGELGLQLVFELPSLAAMHEADEVFMTSTIREICPVVRIDGAAIRDGKPGPLSRALLVTFRRYARDSAQGTGDAL